MALTPKQEAFVNEYLIDFNATQAAIRAGYSARTARSQGHRLLTNVDIIEEVKLRVADKAMTADEVLLRLADIARGDMSDFLELKDGVSTPYLNFRQAKERGKLHLIKKFKYSSEGYPEIELYSGYDALVQLGRAHKLFVERQEVTGADGGEILIKLDR